ncbi:MAG: flavodoxin-dependent (E)-4-hydroxy-3-methylbut-2-enyl-diphosphate synthase [Treponema sp.]|nr:flavodoxin-dependent (E)-4-hydroxy-3-methylbut-2-enyl-diphosphate synthase [Treponema sp.]
MFMIPQTVKIGGVRGIKELLIGGNNPVTIQTMWKEGITDAAQDSEKLSKIIERIESLKLLGCDIIRFAVPDMESASSLRIIQERTDVPLVADIHFDWRLALACLDDQRKGSAPAAVRINPGNIGSRDRVEAVVKAAKNQQSAIRIGVNSGSIPKDLEKEVLENKLSRAKALSIAALREVSVLKELSFNEVVVSMKASSVSETIEANEAFVKESDIPLHIGVTEAGPLITGVVKSTLAFSHLLREGIGSTIRVSLSSTPENEVIAGRNILHECGLRKGGINLVSCPRCGRIGFDVHSFVERWQPKLLTIKENLTIAVMGCVVNGPGEGKHADLGIAGGDGKAVIFSRGKVICTVNENEADSAFERELSRLISSSHAL